MFDRINKIVSSTLSDDLRSDLKNNVDAVFRNGLEKMDLVTREQFDIQQKILERTREKLEALEVRVEQLEKEYKK